MEVFEVKEWRLISKQIGICRDEGISFVEPTLGGRKERRCIYDEAIRRYGQL